jgi:hypothetical protein
MPPYDASSGLDAWLFDFRLEPGGTQNSLRPP